MSSLPIDKIAIKLDDAYFMIGLELEIRGKIPPCIPV